MYTAGARRAAEQWLVPPEPALNRYLLHSRRRAANDNSRLSSKATVGATLIGSCMALICVLSLVVALIQP
jgi:hypothetical protein